MTFKEKLAKAITALIMKKHIELLDKFQRTEHISRKNPKFLKKFRLENEICL